MNMNQPDNEFKFAWLVAALGVWLTFSSYIFTQYDQRIGILGCALLALIVAATILIKFDNAHWILITLGILFFGIAQYVVIGPDPEFLLRTLIGVPLFVAAGNLGGAISREMRGLVLENQRHREIIQEISETDALGLIRWDFFKRRLDIEVSRSRRSKKPLSLLLLELMNRDGLVKEHGEHKALEMERQAYKLITSLMRPFDMASLHNGTHLALVLPEASEKGALAAAQRFIGSVEDQYRLSFCAAIAAFPEDAVSAQRLLEAAQLALDWANRSSQQIVTSQRVTRQMASTE
jgi:GGDEF domain-containing protein